MSLSAESAAAIGIDAGSTTLKVVVVDAAGQLIDQRVAPSKPLVEPQVAALLAELSLADGQLPIAATGYGRKRITVARKRVTEITCHARGAFALTGRAGLLIDLGGQDSKAIRIDESGAVVQFAMNDRCAAGTGRFLEVTLGRLDVALDEVGDRVSADVRPVSVSSTCTVFAETEIISLLAEGVPVAGILAGLHRAFASRIAALAAGVARDGAVFASGGVARNPLMIRALAEALGRPVEVVPTPQLVGALGAALSLL